MAKGFTKMDNGFLEAIYQKELKISRSDTAVLLCLYRYTVGYHKEMRSISFYELAEKTGYSLRQVKRSIKCMCDCGWIQRGQASGKKNNYFIDTLAIMKDAETSDTFGTSNGDTFGTSDSDRFDTSSGDIYDTEVVTDLAQDTIIKKNKRNVCKESGTHTPVFFSQLWEEYPQKVGKGKLTDEDYAALDRYSYSELHRAIERYKRDKEAKGIDYWQNGSTFFKTGYIDYLDENYTGEERTRERALDPSGKEYEG